MAGFSFFGLAMAVAGIILMAYLMRRHLSVASQPKRQRLSEHFVYVNGVRVSLDDFDTRTSPGDFRRSMR